MTCSGRFVRGLCIALAAGAAGAQTDAALGLQILSDRSGGNCVVCHNVPGVAGPASDFGPPLRGLGARYSADQLRQWVTDARQIKPDTLMPPFGTTQGTLQFNRAAPLLSPEQINWVVAALQTLQ
jgi:sulfur-oxidizing protein SoxX